MSRRSRELEAERDAARKDADVAGRRADNAEASELAIREKYGELAETVAEKQGDNAKKIADAAGKLEEMAQTIADMGRAFEDTMAASQSLAAQLALVTEERDQQRTSLQLSMAREQVLADELAAWHSWHAGLSPANQDGPVIAPRPRDWREKIGPGVDTEGWRPDAEGGDHRHAGG